MFRQQSTGTERCTECHQWTSLHTQKRQKKKKLKNFLSTKDCSIKLYLMYLLKPYLLRLENSVENKINLTKRFGNYFCRLLMLKCELTIN